MKHFLYIFLCFYCLNSFGQVENHDVRLGNKYYKTKDYGSAEQKYRTALSKKEVSFYANYNLANTLYRKNDLETARNYYQKALLFSENNRQKADVYHNVGCSFLMEKKWSDAVDAFKKSMMANPNDNETRKLLAYAMRMDKRDKKQNPPPPNSGNKKMEDNSQDENRQFLENLDNEDENRQPNAGGNSKVKNW